MVNLVPFYIKDALTGDTEEARKLLLILAEDLAAGKPISKELVDYFVPIFKKISSSDPKEAPYLLNVVKRTGRPPNSSKADYFDELEDAPNIVKWIENFIKEEKLLRKKSKNKVPLSIQQEAFVKAVEHFKSPENKPVKNRKYSQDYIEKIYKKYKKDVENGLFM